MRMLLLFIVGGLLVAYGILWAVKPLEHLKPCQHFALGAIPEETSGTITFGGKHLQCMNGELVP